MGMNTRIATTILLIALAAVLIGLCCKKEADLLL